MSKKDLIDKSLYPSNSQRVTTQKPIKEEEIKPKVEKVVTGDVKRKKKTIGDKFKDTFLVSDSKTVGGFVFTDVIVPTVKELIIDIINKGSNMLVFGDTRTVSRDRGSYSGRNTRFDYGGLSTAKVQDSNRRRQIDGRIRATHQFDNLVFDTAWEAEDVRDKLVELIETYGQATVADFYDAAGITSEYTDNKYGWEELGSAKIRKASDGYVILLPRAVFLGE